MNPYARSLRASYEIEADGRRLRQLQELARVRTLDEDEKKQQADLEQKLAKATGNPPPLTNNGTTS